MTIILSKVEHQYLIKADFLDKEILDVLSNAVSNKNGDVKIDMPEDLIDRLFDKLEDRLQMVGFDNNYELTKEGSIIENLIDRLTSN